VLTALRKDPQRRYGSVQELSDDVARHLEGMPIRARADSRRYRAAKFICGIASASQRPRRSSCCSPPSRSR
jgi:hypothetical protein